MRTCHGSPELPESGAQVATAGVVSSSRPAQKAQDSSFSGLAAAVLMS